jgi:hypothetical protein
MVTFVSASVTPDALLFALWGLALWLGTRILKRGLSAGSVAALFAIVGLAIVVKATSYALLPAALLVLVVGLRRRHGGFAGLLAPAAAALAGLLATAGVWHLIAHGLDRAAAAQVSSATGTAGLNPMQLASYVWQFYLPRLPFMTDFGVGGHTLGVYEIWFKGTWATFGWTEVLFRNRVYAPLAVLAVVVIVAAGVELWRSRARYDLVVGAFLALATISLVGGLHWSEYRLVTAGAGAFNQGRYLLPLAGIAGVVLALALRRLRAAHRPVVVAAVLGGLLALQVLSLGLVLERFYA